MAQIFNEDFQDFLRALKEAGVRYMLIGGYSVILHGYPRTTGDMDVWVERTADNHARLAEAFARFGLPIYTMTQENFLANERYDVFTYGRPPLAIDILNKVKGLDFTSAYTRSILRDVDGIQIRLIDYQDLLIAKRAAGRLRDLNDIEQLERNKGKS